MQDRVEKLDSKEKRRCFSWSGDEVWKESRKMLKNLVAERSKLGDLYCRGPLVSIRRRGLMRQLEMVGALTTCLSTYWLSSSERSKSGLSYDFQTEKHAFVGTGFPGT